MKRLSSTVSLFLFWIINCYAQQIHKLNKDTSHYKTEPVYVLLLPQQKPLVVSSISLISVNPDNIDSLLVFKYPSLTATYGVKAINGVIRIKLKKAIDLQPVNEIFNLYHINKIDRALPVFIDSVITRIDNNVYIDPTIITYVRIEKETGTTMNYISIRSKNKIPLPDTTKDVIYIRGIANNQKQINK